MKRKILAGMLLVFLVLGAVLGILLFPQMKNEAILSDLVADFSDAVAEHSSQPIVEAKGIYGKLNGNGNGIQFFGAVLVKKDSVKDPQLRKASLEKEFETVELSEQVGSEIVSKYLEHRSLSFDAAPKEGEGYLAVCFFTTRPDGELSDPMGH